MTKKKTRTKQSQELTRGQWQGQRREISPSQKKKIKIKNNQSQKKKKKQEYCTDDFLLILFLNTNFTKWFSFIISSLHVRLVLSSSANSSSDSLINFHLLICSIISSSPINWRIVCESLLAMQVVHKRKNHTTTTSTTASPPPLPPPHVEKWTK